MSEHAPADQVDPEAEALQFDFSREIEAAISQAPLVALTESGENIQDNHDQNKESHSPVADLRDETIIHVDRNFAPNQVITYNPEEYLALLEQALQRVDGATVEWSKQMAKLLFEHEMQHADAAQKAVPDIKVGLGVTMIRHLKEGREEIGLQPQAQIGGSMRKIDFAYILAAPEELSEDDIQRIRFLGYSGPEEVKERWASAVDG